MALLGRLLLPALAALSLAPLALADTFQYDAPTRIDRNAGSATWKEVVLPVSYVDSIESISVNLNLTDAKSINAVLTDPSGMMVGRFAGVVGAGEGSLSKQYVIDHTSIPEVSGNWTLRILAYGKSLDAPVTLDKWSITIDDGKQTTGNDDGDDQTDSPSIYTFDKASRIDRGAEGSAWKQFKLNVPFENNAQSVAVTLNFLDIKYVNAVLTGPSGTQLGRYTGKVGTGEGSVSKQYIIGPMDLAELQGDWTLTIMGYGKTYKAPVILDSWSVTVE